MVTATYKNRCVLIYGHDSNNNCPNIKSKGFEIARKPLLLLNVVIGFIYRRRDEEHPVSIIGFDRILNMIGNNTACHGAIIT